MISSYENGDFCACKYFLFLWNLVYMGIYSQPVRFHLWFMARAGMIARDLTQEKKKLYIRMYVCIYNAHECRRYIEDVAHGA